MPIKNWLLLKSVFINSDKQAKTTAFFQMALKDVLWIIKGSHRLFGIVENGIIQCSHKRLQDSFKRSTAPCFWWSSWLPMTSNNKTCTGKLELISLWTPYVHCQGKMATRAWWLGIANAMLLDSQKHGFTWANKDKTMVLKINNNKKQLYWPQKNTY